MRRGSAADCPTVRVGPAADGLRRRAGIYHSDSHVWLGPPPSRMCNSDPTRMCDSDPSAAARAWPVPAERDRRPPLVSLPGQPIAAILFHAFNLLNHRMGFMPKRFKSLCG